MYNRDDEYKWKDEYNIMHHATYPLSMASENGPLFLGTNIVLKNMTNNLLEIDIIEFIDSIEKLYTDRWHTTPKSPSLHFSHDNMTGIVCALKACRSFLNSTQYPGIKRYHLESRISHFEALCPIFDRQRLHPRDLMFYSICKYPKLQYLFYIPLMAIMIVSAYQTYKIRGSKKDGSYRKIIKTDGKIIALLRCAALGWSLKWIEKALFRLRGSPQWSYQDWSDVFQKYYTEYNHPNFVLSEDILEEE